MELYLDSADLKEIEEVFKLGFVAGLTTTPTFMHREGITELDSTIVKISKMVPMLQIEALGNNADEICAEAHRLLKLGLDKKRTVFKIPASLEAMKATKRLRDEDIMVNIHLVYNLQQAYMAMAAGANYICILVGRMQDQGYNALELVEECVNAVRYYGYNSKIMFSSVRHTQHVRESMMLGAHTCTIPWKVMKQLTENNFTAIGTDQFIAHTRLITMKVKDVVRSENPVIGQNKKVSDALVKMTESGLGAVSIVDENSRLLGLFTDGDLRRQLKNEGAAFLQKNLSDFNFTKTPITISPDAILQEAVKIFKEKHIDNILVVSDGKPAGVLDIQDLINLNLMV